MSVRKAQFRITVVASLLVAATSLTLAGGRAPVMLESAVEAKSETLTLQDLLPPGAPLELQEEASGIALGSTPQPGSVRAITRDQIEDLLRADPELLASLSLPERIIVSRSQRELTAQELSVAITEAAKGGGAGSEGTSQGAGPELQSKQKSGRPIGAARLSAPVYVTKDDPGLKVLRVEFDPLRHETRFCLWTTKEPEILPFYVTVAGGSAGGDVTTLVARRDLAPGEIVSADDFLVKQGQPTSGFGQTSRTASAPTPEALAGLAALTHVRAGQAVTASMFKTAVMVSESKPAVLVIEGPAFRMTMPVIPLQNGALGQQVRVRNPDTQRIVSAEVVGPGQLHKTLEN